MKIKLAVIAGLVALGIGQITAQMMPIRAESERTPFAAEMRPDGMMWPKDKPQEKSERAIIKHGLDSEINSNTPTVPELGFVDITTKIFFTGTGGERLFECDPNELPWLGNCESKSTNVPPNHCAPWQMELRHIYGRIPCDGNIHYFPTKVYWVQYGNGYHKVAEVTPKWQAPNFCWLVGYSTTNNVNAQIPPCQTDNCAPLDWLCACTDNGHGYTPDPRCCPGDWTTICATCWDPNGQLQYCCCCHYDPIWGWICQ